MYLYHLTLLREIELLPDRNKNGYGFSLALCVIYLLAFIYGTIVYSTHSGFISHSMTSLYIMILGLFFIFVMNSLQEY